MSILGNVFIQVILTLFYHLVITIFRRPERNCNLAHHHDSGPNTIAIHVTEF